MNSGMNKILRTTYSFNSNGGVGNSISLGLGLGGAASSRCRKNRNNSLVVTMRDRGNNRKPLQKGRSLSIEAIQTVQALKLAKANSSGLLELELETSFRRLLKLDMMAVLRELIRQNQCCLALKKHLHSPQYW